MPTGVLMSHMRYDDVIIIQVMHMGWIIWYSGRVSPFGRRKRVAHVWRVGPRGQPPLQPVLARAGMSHVRILRCFHQWLRLFLLYIVVWSKHKFDNFHF